MQEISIKGMEFYAYHGCFKEEQSIGTFFNIDACFELDFMNAAQSDDLSQTLNYAQVYQIIKKIVNIPVKTLEHLAYKILEELFNHFPIIRKATITVYKLNPPLGGKINRVGVTLSKNR